MESFQDAVERFKKANDWLSDEHALALSMLENTAVELDQEFKAATASIFMQATRQLARQGPVIEGSVDALDALLDDVE